MAELHLRALRRIPTAHVVVGVHDVRPAAAQAFARRAGAPAYTGLAALLADARPNLVHVCTPAGAHDEPARAALLAGAHVYVEKPFVETLEEAERLFALARERGLLICAGHQLVRDRSFRQLMQLAPALRPITLVDSVFSFRPPRLDPYRSSGHALGRQLVDVLPHPLYTLVEALERLGPPDTALEIVNVSATSTDLHALLRVGMVSGRLYVSLRARPVASTLAVTGARGTLTTDFVRAIVFGAANEGTSPAEKIANPFLESAQLAWRSAASLTRRLVSGGDYPGLAELLGEFYAAVAGGRPSPVRVDHLRAVTGLYQTLAAQVQRAAHPRIAPTKAPAPATSSHQVVVVTGAGGFFGRHITRELARRGFRVRGVGRSEPPDDPSLHEWIRADLAEAIPAAVCAGATVVVHAAAETAGGFDAHERNTVATTRHLLGAMADAHVRRLIHISSISVLRPPRPFWERQTERTPCAASPETLGPYTWAKCATEELVAAAHARREIQARIIRPAALIDWEHIELPGLLGRRLFGHWYLGLGRPGLPLAVCPVGQAGAAVAWCANHFAEAPPIVNLIDPAIRTRGELLDLCRAHGWQGHVTWLPIGLLAGTVIVAHRAAALVGRERARRLAAWSILRPRRYDPAMGATLLAAASEEVPLAPAEVRASAAERVSRAYA